ncbi:hypothetical protein [Nioella aestuarii]|uniref:hypothetical protein n=1 Tax=Nioella aestuarii TaxID=1662864 RepID=UPI003D7FC925
MKPLFLSADPMLDAAAAVHASMNYPLGGDEEVLNSKVSLTHERDDGVQVGPEHALIARGIQTSGHGSAAPIMSFRLARMDHHPLEIRGKAHCDTVLLATAAGGTWHNNDDGPYGQNPQFNLRGSAPSNGRVDVWVDSCAGQTCFGGLILESDG